MVDWIREHPYLTGTLALALVVVFFLYRRGSGSTVSYAGATGPSDAAIQSGNALQAAQIAAGVQIAGYNAAVNAAQLGYAADVQKTQIAGNVALQNILSSADVTKYITDAQLRLGLAQAGQIVPSGSTAGNTPIVYGQTQAQQNQAISESTQKSTINDLLIWSFSNSGPVQAYADSRAQQFPGLMVHGIVEENCSAEGGDILACVARNTARVEASYQSNPGSYLGAGAYA